MHPQKSFQSNQYNDNYIQTTNYKNKLKVSFRRNNLSKKDFILDERSRMYSISCQYTFKDASIDAKLSVPADKWDAFLDSNGNINAYRNSCAILVVLSYINYLLW